MGQATRVVPEAHLLVCWRLDADRDEPRDAGGLHESPSAPPPVPPPPPPPAPAPERTPPQAGRPEVWSDSAQRLTIRMTPRPGHALVELDGTVDDRTIGLLGKSLDRALDASGPSVVLDLSLAKMMSVDWVAAVNAARGRAAERGGRVLFVAPSETAGAHIDLLELGALYPSLASIEEAEQCLAGQVSGAGPAAVPANRSADDLAGELGDPDPAVRRGAARALAALGRDARAASPALARALRDEDAEVRDTALAALKALGPAAESVVWDIVDCLRDETARPVALEALVAIGPASLGAVRTIVADPDPAVSQSAAQALRVIQERLR